MTKQPPRPDRQASGPLPATRWYRSAVPVLVTMAVVAVHLVALKAVEGTGLVPVAVALYLLPSVVTLICRRPARRHWWRFVVLFATAFVTEPGAFLAVFFVAETWVLHRCWVTEADPGRTPVAECLRPGRLSRSLRARVRHGASRDRRMSAATAWKRGAD